MTAPAIGSRRTRRIKPPRKNGGGEKLPLSGQCFTFAMFRLGRFGTMARCGEHAIVIGASMGGLLAARALSEHYDRVTLIERDALPEAPEPREDRGRPRLHDPALPPPAGAIEWQTWRRFRGLLPGLAVRVHHGAGRRALDRDPGRLSGATIRPQTKKDFSHSHRACK